MSDKIINVCNRTIFFGLFLLIFLLPLVFNAKMDDAFALPKITLFRITVLICGMALLIRSIENRMKNRVFHDLGKTDTSKRRIFSPMNFPILAFLLVSIVATLRSPNIHLSFVGAHKFYFWGLSAIIGYVIIYFIVLGNLEVKYIEKSIDVILIGSGLVAIYGILQHFGLDFVHWAQPPKERIFSTFGNPNFLGAYLIMVIPLALSRLVAIGSSQSSIWKTSYKGPILRWMLVLLCGMLFTCLLWTLTRGAWVGFFASLLVFGVLVGKKRLCENRKWLSLVLIIFAFIATIFILPKSSGNISTQSIADANRTAYRKSSVVGERVSSILEMKEIGIAGRICAWKDTLKMVKEHPFLGMGLDTFGLTFQKYKSTKFVRIVGKNMIADYPHNEFLQVAATMGLIGLAVYLWLWITFLTTGISLILQTRRFTVEQNKPGLKHPVRDLTSTFPFIVPGIVASVVALLIQNQFGFSTLTTSTLFWFLMGITMGLKNRVFNPHYRSIIQEVKLDVGKPRKPAGVQWKFQLMRSIVYPVILVSSVLLIIIILRPYFADFHFMSGLVYSKYKIWDKAIVEYQSSLSLNPRGEKYRMNLGNAYKEKAVLSYSKSEKKMWIEKAILAFEKNIEMNPLDSYRYNDLGTAYMWKAEALGEPTADLAIDTFLRGVDLFPNFVDGLNNLAWAYSHKGMFDQAIVLCKCALEIAPDDVLVNYNLGSAYANIGRRTEAIRHWRRALAIDPNYEDAKRNLERMAISVENEKGRNTETQATNRKER
ncbi:MAG: O-antigen ligase family protein [Candidatus Bathyarchaeota archaeon]|nr:O-antigen ligase family protein [Candidatus Bathyarchaeota archaeon]